MLRQRPNLAPGGVLFSKLAKWLVTLSQDQRVLLQLCSLLRRSQKWTQTCPCDLFSCVLLKFVDYLFVFLSGFLSVFFCFRCSLLHRSQRWTQTAPCSFYRDTYLYVAVCICHSISISSRWLFSLAQIAIALFSLNSLNSHYFAIANALALQYSKSIFIIVFP